MSIRIDGLTHVYMPGTCGEKIALRDVTMEVRDGSALGIAGCNGSGKSTLIHHLNGILKPSRGSISVNGLDVTERNLREVRSRVGIVFQHPEQQLFEETVFREVAFALEGSPITPIERAALVRAALGAVGIGEELMDVSPFALSAGLRRRVAVASVLAGRPEVLVLDEPTAGLDPTGRRDILDLLVSLKGRGGMTVILVSHNLEDIAHVCDRVIVLKDGMVAMDGGTREVLCDAEGIERAGLAVPTITAFMARLKRVMPGLDHRLLTVEEARNELNRLMGEKKRCRSAGYERNDHGELLPRRFGDPQVGSQDENNPCRNLFDRCVSC